MPPMTGRARVFDSDALYVALDRKRRTERITWRELQRRAGISSQSTATRLGQDKTLSADNLIRFLLWLGQTDIAPFVVNTSGPYETTTDDR